MVLMASTEKIKTEDESIEYSSEGDLVLSKEVNEVPSRSSEQANNPVIKDMLKKLRSAPKKLFCFTFSDTKKSYYYSRVMRNLHHQRKITIKNMNQRGVDLYISIKEEMR